MTASRPAYKPAPLSFLVIWESKIEYLIKLAIEEQNAKVKKYLELLAAYHSTLTDNNPRYNIPVSSPVTEELLTNIASFIDELKAASSSHNPAQTESKSDTQQSDEVAVSTAVENLAISDSANLIEITAAVYTLQGLVQHGIGEDVKATDSFDLAYNKTSNLVSRAVILNQIESLRNREFLPQQRKVSKLVEIVDMIRNVQLDKLEIEAQHNVASIYSSLAYAYRKTNEANSLELAEQNYTTALKYWPGSLVIMNRAAILYSKVSTLEALEKAEAILAKLYDDNSLLMVTPYYRADVAIKLAALYKDNGDNAKYAEHVAAAERYLKCADNARKNNPKYSENYKTKASTRIDNLRANLAVVTGDLQQASELQKKLTKVRTEEVDEGKGSPEENKKAREKFLAKLIDTTKEFNKFMLFRRPVKQPVQPVSEARVTKSTGIGLGS
jgi:hypothetical protein